MQLTVQGKQIDVGDALRARVTEKLEELNNKYFNHATFATVTFSKEGHGHGVINVHIHIRIGKDIAVMADAQAGDAHGAFENGIEKITKQLRRYKNRLRDHRERLETSEGENLKARYYTLASEEEAQDGGIEQGEDPVIIAEISAIIQTMSVSDAVMRLDLSGQSALLFRNAKHQGLNMVYRRPDGNIGWVDPAQEKAAKKETKKEPEQKPAAKSVKRRKTA